MYDNYNYPPGADNPSAPWNQSDPEEIELDVDVTYTLEGQEEPVDDTVTIYASSEDDVMDAVYDELRYRHGDIVEEVIECDYDKYKFENYNNDYLDEDDDDDYYDRHEL